MEDNVVNDHMEKLWAAHLVSTHNVHWGLADEGIIDPAKMRITPEYRKEQAKELTMPVAEGGKGLSKRQAAKVLGVGHQTVLRDLVQDGPESGPQRTTKPKPRAETETTVTFDVEVGAEEDFGECDAPENNAGAAANAAEQGADEPEDPETLRIRELQEVNNETREAKSYASLFYMTAYDISQLIEDGVNVKDVVNIMRRRRYVLKVDVTPEHLRIAGELFLRLAKQETMK